MISTFGGFSTAKLGIRSSQQGLQITGNNITNINTDGYTRQRINQQSLYHGTADRYSVSTDVRMGFGSLVTSISQIRDPFLDIRYRNEASNMGFYDEKLANLEGLKAVLDEVSKDGIHTAFEEIRTQLQHLTTSPTEKVNDRLVRSACQKLVSLLNKYSADLNTQKENSLQGFTQNVDEVNKILTQIRDLNGEIRTSQIHGDPALEMLDNRNMLIDKLSEMTKIKVSYTQEKIGEGIFVDKLTIELDAPGQDPATRPILVDGEFANKLEITPADATNGKPDINAENYQVNLGGLTNVKGDTPVVAQIKEQMKMLNGLTNSMQGINQQLADVNKQIGDWKTDIGNNNPVFAETDFDHTNPDYEEKLKKLQEAVDKARANLKQNNNPTTQAALKKALDDQAAFKRFDQQKQKLDNQKAGLEKQFNSKFTALEKNLKELDPPLTIARTQNANDTFSVTINDGNPPVALNKTLIDGTTPNTPPLKFEITEKIANNAPDGIDLQLGGTTFGSKTQAQLDAAAHTKKPVDENQWYGVMKADLEHLNGKGEFGNPPSKIRGIAYYQRSLDSLAQTFAETMNELNRPLKLGQDGKPIPINPADPTQGFEREEANLFDNGKTTQPGQTPDPITASNISISKEWLDGTVTITTSIDPAGSDGDNANVLNMIQALNDNQQFYIVDKDGYRLTAQGERLDKDNNILDAQGRPTQNQGDPVKFFNGSFESMFTNMNAVLGSDMSATATMLNNAAIATNERAVARDNVSSVDLNEEGINLVQYQKSFAAACRVMTTLDEMLDTLLNVKR